MLVIYLELRLNNRVASQATKSVLYGFSTFIYVSMILVEVMSVLENVRDATNNKVVSSVLDKIEKISDNYQGTRSDKSDSKDESKTEVKTDDKSTEKTDDKADNGVK